mgnify:CR=1 FL=1
MSEKNTRIRRPNITKGIVNSTNEWDSLEEVIVGRGVPSELPAIEFTFKLFFHDNIYNTTFGDGTNGYITRRHIDEHNEDVENFAALLQSHNIIVKRPKLPERIYKIKTQHWESVVHPALNVRDQTMIVDDTIIETPPSCRWRYFENDYMKHLFLDYFKQGAKWIQAPKPLMLDESFDLDYVEKMSHARQHYEALKKQSYMACGHEIMFDAANCMRLDEHILVNVSNKNQELGAKWLQDVLPNKKILTAPLADSHIDSSILFLRPGVAIVAKPQVKDKLPAFFDDWDLIYIPMRNRSDEDYTKQGIKLASPQIELNILSINPNTILCHPEYRDLLHSALSKYKIDVIPSQIRHCEIFSGAHHCITLDIRRKA